MNEIKSLENEDKVEVAVFGKTMKIPAVSVGDNSFDDNGNEKRSFSFNAKELELLNWILQNVKLEDYSSQILQYVNGIYFENDEKEISEKDLKNEIEITAIVVNILDGLDDDFCVPDVSFIGECRCDQDGGICIGFRNKEFLGIDAQDWTL